MSHSWPTSWSSKRRVGPDPRPLRLKTQPCNLPVHSLLLLWFLLTYVFEVNQVAAGMTGSGVVTVRPMSSARRSHWAGALCGACLLVLGVGCGRAEDDLAAVRRAAQEAASQLGDLDTRVDELATAIQSTEVEVASSDREREHLATRLERTAKRLRGSVTRLRNAMGEAQASSSEASSAASTALARAEEIVRSLAVLQNRYDYHLRRYHGGG
jgi:hypothetical protein